MGVAFLGKHLTDPRDFALLQRGKQVAPNEDSVLTFPFDKTLRDEDLHPPALGLDHLPTETAINGLSPIASDELPVKPRRPIRPDLRFQIEGWEDSDGQCPPSLRVVLGGALFEILGDDPIVGINALDDARRRARLPAGAHAPRMRCEVRISRCRVARQLLF